MTKFDETLSMPSVFRNNKLGILSISNGEYIIGHFSVFEDISYDEEAETYPIRPPELESLDKSDLYNEGSALLMAFNSGILSDALGAKNLHLTMFGRMRARPFSFNIDSSLKGTRISQMEISVDGSQMEIDAGFESDECLYIVEAKNRHVSEINLRQLYYPYRLWSEKISKKIVPVFLVYTDDTYFIHIGNFVDPLKINSFEIIDSKKYVLTDAAKILIDDLRDIFNSIDKKTKSKYTFPQANSFLKIIDLIKHLDEVKYASKYEITELFGFDPRQTDYYVTAAAFLGLVTRDRKHKSITLTNLGREIMSESYRKRHLDIISGMMSDEVFYECFDYYFKNKDLPSKDFIEKRIKDYYFEDKEKTDTPERRASTVVSWMKWVINLTK